jgi:hypothetical protein
VAVSVGQTVDKGETMPGAKKQGVVRVTASDRRKKEYKLKRRREREKETKNDLKVVVLTSSTYSQ